ncbi:MAG TPA: amidohydrolase family protein [Thermoanaerobaculia bacterium]|nr:amidohydrolase family protein [Thermoanaerobaculia bacterium]
MRKLLCVAGVLLWAGMALPGMVSQAAGQVPAPAAPIVLKAARVFTSTSEHPLTPGMVLVEGNHITQVGASLPVPPGAQVIDLGDATLLPGFIDAHVHLAMELGPDYYRDFYQGALRFPAEQALYAAKYARLTLEAGFTTVRDVGSGEFIALGLRNAINAGIAAGPRMLIANHGIGSTGGHADEAPFPPDRIKPGGTIEGICNGPAQCREAVRYQIKYGADVIKCMPSGGVLSLSDPVDVPELTQEEMNAIVSEAHAWHRKVAAHCHGDAAAKIAIAAGVDSIEHGSFLQDDTLRLMKEKGVYLVPTLFAGAWVGEQADHFPPPIAVKARAASAAMQSMFQRALKAGVKIAFGTDSAVEPHGLDAREFALMVKNGMTPAQALLSATRSGADLLGLADQIGTIETGKLADLVAVPGDPLQDIKQTEKVSFVMQGGKVVKNPAH